MKSTARKFLLALGLAASASFGMAGNQTGPSPTTAPPPRPLDPYLLVAQDKLRFRVEEDPVKSTQVAELLVTALGEVNFPVSRGYDRCVTLNVRGKSLEQVKAELKTKLDADYYQNATIFLQLVNQTQRFGQAQFFGQVKGLVKLPPGEPKTVADGVLELSYDDFANLRSVVVNRVEPATKKTRQITVNVQAVLKGDRSKDLVLQDGDRVQVKERGLIVFN